MHVKEKNIGLQLYFLIFYTYIRRKYNYIKYFELWDYYIWWHFYELEILYIMNNFLEKYKLPQCV